jgi:hypothetical protein
MSELETLLEKIREKLEPNPVLASLLLRGFDIWWMGFEAGFSKNFKEVMTSDAALTMGYIAVKAVLTEKLEHAKCQLEYHKTNNPEIVPRYQMQINGIEISLHSLEKAKETSQSELHLMRTKIDTVETKLDKILTMIEFIPVTGSSGYDEAQDSFIKNVSLLQ